MTHSENTLPPGFESKLLRQITCSVVIVDTDGKIMFVNAHFADCLGYEVSELMGQDWFTTCFDEHEGARLRGMFLQEVNGSDCTDVECIVKAKADYLDMAFHYTAIRGDDGEVSGVGFIGGDVSSRHMAEEAMLEGQLRLSSVLDTAVDVIIVIDERGIVVSCNKAMETLFGISTEALIGQNVSMLMASPHRENHDSYIENYLETGRAKIIGRGREVMGRRGDGSTFPLKLSVGREFKLGDKIYFTGFIRDLSREKHIENQLRQAQKMESIGTLAGGIAHDFNNILGGIMGYVDLMLEDAEPGSYLQEDLTEMRNACQRGKDLILQILTFSRQDKTQKMPLQFKPVIKESLKLLRAIIPANIEIRSDIDTEVPPVMADATQIHQIMMNLCTNAYHAQKDDGGYIQIELCKVQVDEHYNQTLNLTYGSYVRITVRDNGHGMDESTKARIFDPFFTTKSQGQGTGMGLAVVHGIVQNHGGEIQVSSDPGHGARFDLFFPVWESEAEEELPSMGGMPPGRERIMLVDDDQLLLKVQSRILSRRGYTVTTFTNGQDALEAFMDAPNGYEMLITDQTMPKLTGMELASEIMVLNPDLPIIITTGFSDVVTPKKVRERGIRELLRKPVDSEELCQAVRRVLDEGHPS